MILREEIDAVSVALGIDASNVQRDYVFGWILAGLYGDSDLGGRLVLKGRGTLSGKGTSPLPGYPTIWTSPRRAGPIPA